MSRTSEPVPRPAWRCPAPRIARHDTSPPNARDHGRHSVTNISTVAAVMMTAVAQPSHRRSSGLTRFPMTVGSLVSSTTSRSTALRALR
jgi:hypothetical protein